MPFLTMLEQRASVPELLDGPDFGAREVSDTFRILVPVNRWFGGVRPTLSFFRCESRTWDRGETYRILDVGCGAGDVARALVEQARASGHRLRLEAIDKHPEVAAFAQRECLAYPEITVSCQDVHQLSGQQHDYVHASQFIHHFPDEAIAPLLGHMLGLCRRRLVVNDLVRAPLAYLGAWLFTLWTPAVFRHDARVSVRRGFKMDEVKDLLRAGGIDDFCLNWHFFYRFLLIVDRESSPRVP
jgi:SAM-dependent methyltransferase